MFLLKIDRHKIINIFEITSRVVLRLAINEKYGFWFIRFFSQDKLWVLNLSMSIRIYGQDAKSAEIHFSKGKKKKEKKELFKFIKHFKFVII